jgi:hypothetical protein
MNYKDVSSQTYKKFSFLEGNDYIAGDYALEVILKLIKDFKIKSILELGLGIGSISDAVLNYAKYNGLDIKYVGTESNTFCLNALKSNVDEYKSIELYRDLIEISEDKRFDLIIIDGSDDGIKQLANSANKHGVVFIEGGRASQIKVIKDTYNNALIAEVISARKPPNYGPARQKWTGGGSLIFIDSNNYQRCYWFAEKTKTYIKRRLRRFIKN